MWNYALLGICSIVLLYFGVAVVVGGFHGTQGLYQESGLPLSRYVVEMAMGLIFLIGVLTVLWRVVRPVTMFLSAYGVCTFDVFGVLFLTSMFMNRKR